MYNRQLIKALTMAFHNRGRLQVVQDKISLMYFTQEEYTGWLAALEKRLAQNMSFYRKGETVMKIMNRTAAGQLLAYTAFARNSLKTAVLLGTKQYVIVDAGYDTFAYRQPDWAANMQIFEINPLDIAMDKQARLTRADITPAENVNYIYADINKYGWQRLLADHIAFDKTKVTFVNLGDIQINAGKQQFEIILQRLADVISAGSSIVFSYNTADYEIDTGRDIPCGEMDMLMSRYGFLIYEQLEKQQVERQFFRQYNIANIRTPLKAPQDVGYILAVKKEQ